MARWKFLACFAFLAAACAPNPPYLAGDDLPERVHAAVPALARDADVFGPAGWYPNIDGLSKHYEKSADLRPYRGALAIDDIALVFVIWDRNLGRIDPAKRIPLSDIVEVSVDHWYRRHVMVLRLRDGSFHTFGIGNENEPSHEALGRAVERISSALRERKNA